MSAELIEVDAPSGAGSAPAVSPAPAVVASAPAVVDAVPAVVASAPAVAPGAFDQRVYRDAMGGFASGVTVITTSGPDGPVGFTCQSFYSVSVDPPLISFSIARTAKSLAAVREHRNIVVNFLSAEQQHLSGQFARSGTDKWQGVEWFPSEANGAPTLAGGTGWVAGEIEQEIEAGDHLIFLVRVAGVSTDPSRAPLLFYRGAYRELEYMI